MPSSFGGPKSPRFAFARERKRTSGSFPSQTTESASRPSTSRMCSLFSNGCTRARSTRAAESVSRSAKKSSNTTTAASGWNPSPAKGQRFDSPGLVPASEVHTISPSKNQPEVLLVDDNPADIDLMCEILGSCKHHYRVHSVSDGEEAISFLHRRGKYGHARLRIL